MGALFALLLLALGGLSACTANETAEAEEQPVQTSVVRSGDITISATGAGTVIAADDISIGFTGSGALAELRVSVGDEVAAGDVLAVLDDTDARKAVADAQLALTQAQLQTDAEATETGLTFNDIAIESALINRDQAQADLDALLNWVVDEDEIALAQAQLDAAQASYQAALGQSVSSSSNITVSEISVTQAERALAEAESAYTTAFDPGRDWELNDPRTADKLEAEREGAAASLLRAQENLTIAQVEHEATVAGSASGSIASAKSSLLSAQQALATAQSGPTEDEINAARIALRQAELAYDQALLNKEADGLSLEQAQLSLEQAEQALSATTLKAPMAGTITAITASPGEAVSGAFITLADLSSPLLEVYLDETDLGNVAVGYTTNVILTAFPEETFTGEVIQVDPSITATGGVSAVRALVRLDYSKPQTLPTGLNATVDIIGGQALNALIVPVEALREITPGEYYVFIMRDGEPVLTPVEVGLMNSAFAEILSGVELGDTVTTGVVATE
jgi:HlyD family secretion protein